MCHTGAHVQTTKAYIYISSAHCWHVYCGVTDTDPSPVKFKSQSPLTHAFFIVTLKLHIHPNDLLSNSTEIKLKTDSATNMCQTCISYKIENEALRACAYNHLAFLYIYRRRNLSASLSWCQRKPRCYKRAQPRNSTGWLCDCGPVSLLHFNARAHCSFVHRVKKILSMNRNQCREYFTCDPIVRFYFGPLHIHRSRWECQDIIHMQYECLSFWSQNDEVTEIFRGHLTRPTFHPLKTDTHTLYLLITLGKHLYYYSQLFSLNLKSVSQHF